MRPLWKAGAVLAAAAALAPATALAVAPASDDVDVITPAYFTPMAQVPVGGVLSAQHTIRAVEATGTLAPGTTVRARVTGTGAEAGGIAYVDRAAGVRLASIFVVSLRFDGAGGATITGVAKDDGVPVSFTVSARRARGGGGTFAIRLSNGYARSGSLGHLVVG